MKVEYFVSDKPFYNNKRIELRSRTYDERPYNIRDNEVDLKYKTGDKFMVYVLNSDKSKFWLKDELEANAKVSEVFFYYLFNSNNNRFCLQYSMYSKE